MIASNEEQQTRYEICKACLFYMKTSKMCMKCACIVPIKVKWKQAQCPEGKWPNCDLKGIG